MSVYDDIKQLIEDEKVEITQAKAAAQAEHNAAISAADIAYDQALSPLLKREDALGSLEQQVVTLAAQAETDPQVPGAPAGESAADTSESSATDAAPASSEAPTAAPEPSSTPTTPADSPSAPSAPAEQATPPAEAIPLADVPDAISSGADSATPVSVPTTSGEIAVVTVADVIEASDRSVPTEALSEPAKTVRQSDLPW